MFVFIGRVGKGVVFGVVVFFRRGIWIGLIFLMCGLF